jgi:hypothetical protein
MLEENVDYRFVNFEGTDITGLELLVDKFKGVVYHYHRARVEEQGELATLKFGYTLIFPGEHDIDELNKNQEFHNLIGEILSQLLMEKVRYDESFGNSNTKEFDPQ